MDLFTLIWKLPVWYRWVLVAGYVIPVSYSSWIFRDVGWPNWPLHVCTAAAFTAVWLLAVAGYWVVTYIDKRLQEETGGRVE
jgi:hypothetical protein